jgi:hypothetical protein
MADLAAGGNLDFLARDRPDSPVNQVTHTEIDAPAQRAPESTVRVGNPVALRATNGAFRQNLSRRPWALAVCGFDLFTTLQAEPGTGRQLSATVRALLHSQVQRTFFTP